MRGAMLYAEHCADCYGKSAQGDGPLAAEFGVATANLTSSVSTMAVSSQRRVFWRRFMAIMAANKLEAYRNLDEN